MSLIERPKVSVLKRRMKRLISTLVTSYSAYGVIALKVGGTALAVGAPLQLLIIGAVGIVAYIIIEYIDEDTLEWIKFITKNVGEQILKLDERMSEIQSNVSQSAPSLSARERAVYAPFGEDENRNPVYIFRNKETGQFIYEEQVMKKEDDRMYRCDFDNESCIGLESPRSFSEE